MYAQKLLLKDDTDKQTRYRHKEVGQINSSYECTRYKGVILFCILQHIFLLTFQYIFEHNVSALLSMTSLNFESMASLHMCINVCILSMFLHLCIACTFLIYIIISMTLFCPIWNSMAKFFFFFFFAYACMIWTVSSLLDCIREWMEAIQQVIEKVYCIQEFINYAELGYLHTVYHVHIHEFSLQL